MMILISGGKNCWLFNEWYGGVGGVIDWKVNEGGIELVDSVGEGINDGGGE